MIAVACAWHESHEKALSEVNKRIARRERMVVAAPALIETYAVLTRLPAPHRMSPRDARSLLEANFIKDTKIFALTPNAYVSLIKGSANDTVARGRTYDAVVAACAIKAKVSVILTFNPGDFSAVADESIEVVVPALNNTD